MIMRRGFWCRDLLIQMYGPRIPHILNSRIIPIQCVKNTGRCRHLHILALVTTLFIGIVIAGVSFIPGGRNKYLMIMSHHKNHFPH